PLTSIISKNGMIYAGSEDAKVYAIRADNSSTVWTLQTGGPVHGRAFFSDGRIYIGSDDKNLYAIDAASGKEIWKVQTLGKVTGEGRSDGEKVFFGSNDGYVYCVHSAAGKIEWRLRTGATVDAAPVSVEDNKRLIVGSYDNFIYSLSLRKGDI